MLTSYFLTTQPGRPDNPNMPELAPLLILCNMFWFWMKTKDGVNDRARLYQS